MLYQIDRSFSDSSFSATLAGTVDVPLGSYMIMDSGANPFTSVNLTLTVNGTPYVVDTVDTASISGSGEFFINATATSLTFSTANSGYTDPADLVFTDNPAGGVNAYDDYAIGSDGAPHFEGVQTGAAVGYVSDTVFPVVWGTAVPEPSTVSFMAIPFAFLGFRIVRARKQVT